MAKKNLKDIAEEIVRERISMPDINFVFDRRDLVWFEEDAETAVKPLVNTWPEEDILDTARAVAEKHSEDTKDIREPYFAVVDELADEIDNLIETWWYETVSAAADRAHQRKEGFTRYFRAYFREGGTDFPAYLGTDVDKAVQAACVADATTRVNGSGSAFLEYRDLPSDETEGKDKNEIKKVWDKTFGGARIPKAVWYSL